MWVLIGRWTIGCRLKASSIHLAEWWVTWELTCEATS